MRKIKFRGHNGTEWIYSETIMQDGDMCYMLNNDTGEWESVSYLGQYTGLKDRNNKEIYEGDIIRESDGDGGYIYAKVVYYKDGFMGKEKGFEPEYPISDFQNEVEVVGNIYENPELLEG